LYAQYSQDVPFGLYKVFLDYGIRIAICPVSSDSLLINGTEGLARLTVKLRYKIGQPQRDGRLAAVIVYRRAFQLLQDERDGVFGRIDSLSR
jgi:hypothetical protein